MHFHYSENNRCIWNIYLFAKIKQILSHEFHAILLYGIILSWSVWTKGKSANKAYDGIYFWPMSHLLNVISDHIWIHNDSLSYSKFLNINIAYKVYFFLLFLSIFKNCFLWMLLFWNIWKSLNMHLPIKQFACISITKDTKPYASFTVKCAYILCNIPCYYMIIRILLFFIEITQLLKWLYW